MIVRLALEEDFPKIVSMAKHNIETTCPHIGFDEYTAYETLFSYLDTAEPTVFVAEEGRELAGFVLASIVGYRASTGHKVICEVLYTDPAYRGSRAATSLVRHVLKWAEGIGAKEVLGGVDNNFQPERTARFLELCGLKRVGYAMMRELQ
jgi:GNAT superfamily N-acetyltransferase